jgi:hypothetical protein
MYNYAAPVCPFFPFPARTHLPAMHAPRILAAAALAVLAGCHGLGSLLEEALKERPPAPLDVMGVASDARIDSAGVLAGSFVGEGTARGVHLLSSDTTFIAELARRYRPDLFRGEGLWSELAMRRTVSLDEETRRRRVNQGLPEIRRALVGSPLGHTDVTVDGIFLHGARRARDCGARGAQAELVVREHRESGDPPLRGPVLGAFLAEGGEEARGLIERPHVPAPSRGLVDTLIERTERVMDSTIAARYPSLQVRSLYSTKLEINTLADLDAADVIPFRAGSSTIRYAVSLRKRRVRAGGRDTLVTTAVMVWDSLGTWRQTIFRPTVLTALGGRLDAFGPVGRPYYWRRLQPVSDVAYARDNLWMEQVNVRDGTVLWGIVQPRGNVVVAAAEVDGVCP